MLAFRSFALGLLGACVMLLARHPAYELHIIHDVRPPPSAPSEASSTPSTSSSARIIDVAPNVPMTTLGALVHLEPGEHIRAIDDVAVADDFEAGSRLAWITPGANRFVDIDVASPTGTRRVLVLLH